MSPSAAAGGSSTKAVARERTTRPATPGVVSKPKARQRTAKQPTVVARGTPHDGSRLGLPLGALLAVPVSGGSTPHGALLVAAALLLLAAAGGGLVVGIFGRRLLRTA